MTTTVVDERPQLDEQSRKRHLRRAVVASTIGTTIEWYDFFLYGSAAALVFPKLFFPSSDPFVGQILSFSTFFVGFVARPLGAALFGHFGDRVGRKALLVITMMTMGVATMAVGLVPSYASIGSWSALLLTAFRALQGIFGGVLFATVFKVLGIDPAKEHQASGGRPIRLVKEGARPIGEVMA